MRLAHGGIATLAADALAGCAALPTPLCLHEANAFQEVLQASAKTVSAGDRGAFAEAFERDSAARRAMGGLRVAGLGPIPVTRSEARVKTLEGNRTAARALVAVRPAVGAKPAVSAWVEFRLARRGGRRLIRDVVSPDIRRWKGLRLP